MRPSSLVSGQARLDKFETAKFLFCYPAPSAPPLSSPHFSLRFAFGVWSGGREKRSLVVQTHFLKNRKQNNADDPARRTNIRNLYNLDRDIVNEMCQAIERMDKGTPQAQRTMGYLLEQLTEMRDRLRSAVIGLGAPPRYPGCPRPGAPVGRQEPDSNYVLGTLVKQQTEALRNPADVQSHVARSQSSGQGV